MAFRPSGLALLALFLLLAPSHSSATTFEGDGGILSLSSFRRDQVAATGGLIFTVSGSVTMRRVGNGYGPRGGFITPLLAPGRPFDVFQIGYDAAVPPGCALSIEARAYAKGAAEPGNWRKLEPEEEVSFGASCDRLQLRIMLSSNGTEAPVLSALTIHEAGYDPTPELRGERVTLVPPRVVPRQRWGALPSRKSHTRLQPAKLTVHHTSDPRASRYTGAATIRAIQQFHMSGRGWNDIAYHYLIGPDGAIYQGRPDWANGSHSPPNGRKLGVCVVGNFNHGQESVTPRARASLVWLLAYLAGKYGISSQAIFGHRDFQSTDCPGDKLYGAIGDLRRQVAAKLRQGGARVTRAGPAAASDRVVQ